MDQIETVIYAGELASVGTFRCPPDHERFGGGTTDAHLAVFPRTAVVIEREHVAPVVADPNTVVFYNPGDHYRRQGIDRRGDHCDYFAVAPDLVAEVLAGAAPQQTGRLGFGHGPSATDLYLAQRTVVTALGAPGPVDSLEVEEAVLAIFATAARRASAAGSPAARRQATALRHAGIVRKARYVLVERACEQISLSDVATEVAVSPFHLARLFRRHTGFTIHAFVTQLRLRRALDGLAVAHVDLATLALELGFSSHSHFTSAFRAAFGRTPSAYRLQMSRSSAELADLRKILTV